VRLYHGIYIVSVPMRKFGFRNVRARVKMKVTYACTINFLSRSRVRLTIVQDVYTRRGHPDARTSLSTIICSRCSSAVYVIYIILCMCVRVHIILYRVHRDCNSSATAGGWIQFSRFWIYVPGRRTRHTDDDDDYDDYNYDDDDDDAAGRYSFFFPAPPPMTGLPP